MLQAKSLQGYTYTHIRQLREQSVRVHILDPAALATSSQALVSFWPYGDVRAGNVTIVLANLLEPGTSPLLGRSWV